MADRIPTFRRSSLEILCAPSSRASRDGRGGSYSVGKKKRSVQQQQLQQQPRPIPLLGEGKTCSVFAAEVQVTSSAVPKRWYAVKCLRSDLRTLAECGATSQSRLVRAAKSMASEAEILAGLGHPHVVGMAGIVKDHEEYDDDDDADDEDDELGEGAAAGGGGGGADDPLGALNLPGSWCPIRGSRDSVAAYPIVLELLSETLVDKMAKWKKQSTSMATFARSFNATIIKIGRAPAAASSKTSSDANNNKIINPVLDEKLKAARQIASAMAYLHDEAGIVYRNLEPSNVGFDSRGDVKLFDFGSARTVPTRERRRRSSAVSAARGWQWRGDDGASGEAVSLQETFRMTACVGSLGYMAPEVYLSKPYNALADVYSYGMVLWEMFALRAPYGGNTSSSRRNVHDVAVRSGRRPKISSKWPRAVGKLVGQCWAERIEDRPDFRTVERTLRRTQKRSQEGDSPVSVKSKSNGDVGAGAGAHRRCRFGKRGGCGKKCYRSLEKSLKNWNPGTSATNLTSMQSSSM